MVISTPTQVHLEGLGGGRVGGMVSTPAQVRPVNTVSTCDIVSPHLCGISRGGGGDAPAEHCLHACDTVRPLKRAR